MWTSCRVNSKLLHSRLVTRADSIDPCSGLCITNPCQTELLIFFQKKTPLEPNKRSFLSLLCCFDMGSPTVASLITSISASAAASITPINSGKSNPSSLTFIVHGDIMLEAWTTQWLGIFASLKISSSKQHTAGNSCILSWLSWWMFKPSIHVRVQYLLFCWMNSPFTVQTQMSPIKTVHLPTKNDSLTWLLDHKILDHATMPRSIV